MYMTVSIKTIARYISLVFRHGTDPQPLSHDKMLSSTVTIFSFFLNTQSVLCLMFIVERIHEIPLVLTY